MGDMFNSIFGSHASVGCCIFHICSFPLSIFPFLFVMESKSSLPKPIQLIAFVIIYCDLVCANKYVDGFQKHILRINVH